MVGIAGEMKFRMRIAIVGSRKIKDFNLLVDVVRDSKFIITEIVSGGAPGVDTLAYMYATARDIPYTEFTAKWNQHGRGAGFLRNKEIVDYADAVIAIWDGKSKGTLHTIKLAQDANKPIYIWKPYEEINTTTSLTG